MNKLNIIQFPIAGGVKSSEVTPENEAPRTFLGIMRKKLLKMSREKGGVGWKTIRIESEYDSEHAVVSVSKDEHDTWVNRNQIQTRFLRKEVGDPEYDYLQAARGH